MLAAKYHIDIRKSAFRYWKHVLSSIAFLSKYGSRDHCLWSTSSPSWTVVPWCPKAKRRFRVKSTQNHFFPQLTCGLTDSSWRLRAERMYPSAVGSPPRDFCSHLEEWSNLAAISGWFWIGAGQGWPPASTLCHGICEGLPECLWKVLGLWEWGLMLQPTHCLHISNSHLPDFLHYELHLKFFCVCMQCSALLIQTQHNLTWSIS